MRCGCDARGDDVPSGWLWPALAAALAGVLLLTVGPPVPAAAETVLPAGSGWPLAGSVVVLKGFDAPATPWGRGHRGVDLQAAVGDPVLAAAPGRVTFAGRLAGRGVVVVDHGQVRTTYEPVDTSLRVGARVRGGDVLGRLSPGAHCGAQACLHWGLRQGERYLDPLALGGTDEGGADTEVVLLPAAARAVAERRAQERAAARLAAATVQAAGAQPIAELSGSGGRSGFGRPVPGRITSPFGRRFHPILKRWKLHDGTDFGAACGTPIRAPFAGVVTRVYRNGAYGNRLFLDHGSVGGARVTTGYNHASRYVVGVGARVSRGQMIGYVGATGYATGCHLHLMVWLDGRLTDPMTWF
jgi:murein DD-endopeptidase MepM/ murein hydrolase activator NlpD